jgi:hypothetical protein
MKILSFASILLLQIANPAFAQQKPNVYTSGTPDVYYKGQKCPQSETVSHESGSKSIDVSCYDETTTPPQQCNVRWTDNTNFTKFSISTYQKFFEQDASVHEQYNFDFVEPIKLSNPAGFGELATRLMNEHCGKPLVQANIRRYKEWSTPTAGLRCTYEEISNGSSVDTLEYYCHDFSQSPTMQCNLRGYGKFNPSIKVGLFAGLFARMRATQISLRTSKNFYVDDGPKTEQYVWSKQESRPMTIDEYKTIAREWMIQHCKR